MFLKKIGCYLSINETAFFNVDLYTILTNKDAKGNKRAIISMVKGTMADVVIKTLHKMPLKQRKKVMDMVANMGLIVKKSFANATLVIDRFHIQKLALDALQEIRIKHRWEALDGSFSKVVCELK